MAHKESYESSNSCKRAINFGQLFVHPILEALLNATPVPSLIMQWVSQIAIAFRRYHTILLKNLKLETLFELFTR